MTPYASIRGAAACLALLACFPSLIHQVTCRPNVFGGHDYQLPGGERFESRSNIFDGEDYRLRDGRWVVCRKNVFGGRDCR